MKKMISRTFAILLSLLVAVASFIGCFSVSAASDVLFKDEFDTSALTGWASAQVGSVSDGTYKLSGTQKNIIAGQKLSAGLGVVANLSVRRIADPETGAPYVSGTSTILFHVDEEQTTYYEYGLGIRDNGSTYLLIYLVRADGSASIVKRQGKNINGVANGVIAENITYELKVLVTEAGTLQFMINNQLFAETADTLKSGSVGVSCWNAAADVEDIRIQELGEQKVESIQVLNVPTGTVPLGEKMGIKIQANYDGIYGSQILNEEATGLKITGYPQKAGAATLTATYGGKSAKFDVNFGAVSKEETVYTADFSKADSWTCGKDSNLPTFAFQLKNNKLTLAYPDVTGHTATLKAAATANIDPSVTQNLYNFRIDATAAITHDDETSSTRYGAVEVCVTSGYTLRVSLNGAVTFYKGSTALATNTVEDIALGKKINITARVCGGVWEADVNGQRVLSYTHTTTDCAALAQVQAVNGGVDVYSYKLTRLVDRSVWYAKSVTLVNGNGTAIKKVTSRVLELDDIFLNVAYGDGSTRQVAVTWDMLSGYDKNSIKDQTITLTYGNFTKTFVHEYSSYLFTDTFDKNHSTRWNFSHPEYAKWYAEDGHLVVDYYNPSPESSLATIATCTGITCADVAVGAQFTLTETSDRRPTYAGVQFRKVGNTMYEYRINYRNGVFAVELYRFEKGISTKVVNYGHKDLLEAMGREYFQATDTFTLRAEAVGNEIIMFINDCVLGVFVDESNEAILQAGQCTIKTVNASAWIDNFYIEEIRARYPVSAQIIGEEDGVIDLYRGFELEPSKYDLNIKYSNGMKVVMPLRESYLSQTGGFELGDNKVTLTYTTYKTDITVRVTERPEYVKAFTDKLGKIDLSALQLSDKAAVTELKEYFDTLSPYEVQNLDSALYKKYCDVIVAMDRLVTPEIADKELLYYNDFSTEATDEEWDFTYEAKLGSWDTRNGYIINEQFKHGISGNSWARLKNVYGEINMIEVDMANVYSATYTAVVWNLTDDGEYYHCRITNKTTDKEGKSVYSVQLYRYSGAHYALRSTYADVHELAVTEGQFNSLRVVCFEAKTSVYVDDKLLYAYGDSSTNALYEGGVAFRSSENDSMYDNIRVYGTPKERPAQKEKEITPTVYEDNFEDETVGKSPSHWQEEYVVEESRQVDAWKVYNKGGSNVYGTTGGQSVFTVLHAFESDPEISTKFMYTGSGKVGVLTRQFEQGRITSADAFTAIGYDTASQKWFVAATESTLQEELQLIWADKATPLTAGEMHDLQVVLSGATLKVTVDGKEVLATDKLDTFAIGKMGFFAQSAGMYVDDVKIVSKLGTIFQDGVLQFTYFESEDKTASSEMEVLDQNTMVSLNGQNYISFNQGVTWQTQAKANTDIVMPTHGGSGYSSIQNYGNGEFISIDGADFTVWRTTDNMRSWTKIGSVFPKEEIYDVYGNFCALFHVASLTEVTLQDGTKRTFLPVAWRRYTSTNNLGHYTRIFYSDDHGFTWKEAENDTREALVGYKDNTFSTVAEGKIIGCADGSLRYYQTRNGYGSVIYFESDDGGVTWNEFGKIPYMQSPLGSFGIDEDPENPGTWYMAWQNSWPSTLGSGYPRVRISLARTTDGKNWEFLTDIERTSSYANNFHGNVRQFLDPSVEVTEDYIYVTYGRSDTGERNSAHNNQIPRFTRMEKDKLTVHAWDDSTVWDRNKAERVELTTLPQTKFGYADLFNTTGGVVTEYNLNGTTTQQNIRDYKIVAEPNMFKLGKQTVQLYSTTLHTVSYEIEIVPNYDLLWTIKGQGTVDPNPDATLRMMEGAEQTFTMEPAKGYKVGSVTINGKKVKVSKNTFTIKDVQENQEITVVFAKRTILDYLIWIVLGAVVVAGTAIGIILLVKKKKPGEVEDISSNRTPPTDEN